MAKRKKRAWHKAFLDYMKFIVRHSNYADMPNKFKPDRSINWVSPSDKGRAAWWDKKIRELVCANRAGVARKIHPKELKGLKPCQVCGKKLSIFYIYPNKNTLKKINNISKHTKFVSYKNDIWQIIDKLYSVIGVDIYDKLSQIFGIPATVSRNRKDFINYIIANRPKKLSPGVMANPPDRLDGFHSYNACCRSKEDTGRHKSNLARYSQDRRAYENWADGDWNLANRLMGEFKRHPKLADCPKCKKRRKMTADHIGPISLGFKHDIRFRALCNGCNSSRNNRMSFEDVKILIENEKINGAVVSWHSKYIWNLLKRRVKNDNDAKRISKLMRQNLHHALIAFSIISEKGHNDFLIRFLQPKYSYFDYRFKDFDPLKTKYDYIEKPLNSKNKKKNEKRYLRIAFESLGEYRKKKNRIAKIWKSKAVDVLLEKTLICLSAGKFALAKRLLNDVFKQLAKEAARKF